MPLTIKSIDLESFSQISVIVDPETEKIKSGLSSGLIVTLKNCGSLSLSPPLSVPPSSRILAYICTLPLLFGFKVKVRVPVALI